MKARVCQLFEVCQCKFANLSLPCEGHFRGTTKPAFLTLKGCNVQPVHFIGECPPSGGGEGSQTICANFFANLLFSRVLCYYPKVV